MAPLASLTVFLLTLNYAFGLFPATGAQGGGVYPRLEIRDMAANYPMQYSLLIQAVTLFQGLSPNSVGSYYQISGIHGAPNTDWDGVSGNGDGYGYCTHGINLFPTWHRPYIALYEQQINAYARTYASLYKTNATAWATAALQLRLPYYDWAIKPASGKSTYPNEMSTPTVTITTASGPKTVNNPFYTYKFPKQVPGFSDVSSTYGSWNYTLRWPSSTDPSATSRSAQVASALEANRPGAQSNLYQMFTQCSNYLWLSDDVSNRPDNCPTSLEDIHGSVHVNIGGWDPTNGHMVDVPVSAFDPSFMLHHCMVDRLLAMWQVIYPNSWVTNLAAGSGTRYIKSGSMQGPTSALAPFRNAVGAFWTSDTVRNVRTFNYTYNEVVSANGNAKTMQTIVNTLYGPSATKTATKRAIGGSQYQYNANIVTSRYGLGGAYVIMLFFGNPLSSDTASWLTDPNFVGSAGILGSSKIQNTNVITSTTVSLTQALSKLGILGGLLTSLDPLVVTPFLKQSLQWRIVKEGQVIDPKSVPGLKITVVKSLLQKDTSSLSGFPTWDSFQEIPDITIGKPGGGST